VVREVRQGEVYWIDFGPAAGPAPAERHPCVVVQSDLFNQSLIATTVVCLITSNLSRSQAPGNVALKKGDAGLPKAGVVNVTQILTVNKTELAERLGTLPAGTIDAIRSGLQLLLSRTTDRYRQRQD
jgi:mRNA interferase MazF